MTISILINCHRNGSDIRLRHIAELADSNPAEALDSLRAIDAGTLSSGDLHLYDFLSVKIPDKAYIRHTSDSLIIKVMEYETRNKSNGRYPEALYYAGRVYSDMGDYPQAIHYFQNALDALSPDVENSDLRANISSQYGRLLTSMGLYRDAIPHINTTLEIDKANNDTVNLIHDLQLLACNHLNAGNLEEAEQIFKQTLLCGRDLSKASHAKSLMYLAYIKSKQGQLDSALYYIHDVPSTIYPEIYEHAIGIAANIYMNAGLNDSALFYARHLICSEDSLSRENGYNILLNPQLASAIPKDSLLRYVNDYHILLHRRFNRQSAQLTINQQTMYNYQSHVLQKELAVKKLENLRIWTTGSIIAILIIISIIFIVKNNIKGSIIHLQKSLIDLKELRNKQTTVNTKITGQPDIDLSDKPEISNNSSISYNSGVSDMSDISVIPDIADSSDTTEDQSQVSETINETQADFSTTDKPHKIIGETKTQKQLRELLQKELIELYNNSSTKQEVDKDILQSDVYWKFKTLIEKGVLLKVDDALWLELEQVVLTTAPTFKSNLLLLLSEKVSISELHTALLIKCGFRTNEMMVLLGKSNGAIGSRKVHLGIRAFDQKLKTEMITSIIRAL